MARPESAPTILATTLLLPSTRTATTSKRSIMDRGNAPPHSSLCEIGCWHMACHNG
jgi:hypothetical protein